MLRYLNATDVVFADILASENYLGRFSCKFAIQRVKRKGCQNIRQTSTHDLNGRHSLDSACKDTSYIGLVSGLSQIASYLSKFELVHGFARSVKLGMIVAASSVYCDVGFYPFLSVGANQCQVQGILVRSSLHCQVCVSWGHLGHRLVLSGNYFSNIFTTCILK